MTEVISGVIAQIYTKEITTKFGPKNVYHAMIDGHDVNLGFKTMLQNGETVSLPVEHKYGGYQLIQGQVVPAGSPSTVGATPVATPSAGPAQIPRAPASRAFPVDTNTKDISIIRQSSLNRAIESVTLLWHQGLFTPITEQDYLDKVFELALLYTDFGSGQREVKQAEAMQAYDTGMPGAEQMQMPA